MCEKHHIEPEKILVVCDDVNLASGKMRLRPSGSAGGHHGLESVERSLESDGFARLRIGIGSESMPKELSGYVLEKFSGSEAEKMDRVFEDAVQVCISWVKQDFEAAVRRLSQLQSNK